MFLPRAIAHDARNRALMLLILAVVFLSLATTAVVLRFVCRRIKRVRLAADDYWIILALVAAYGNGFAEITGVAVGVRGPHSYDLTMEQINTAIRCLVAAEVCWAVSTWALKMSLLLFFSRIFINRSFRIAAYVLMTIVTLFCISTLLTFSLTCTRISVAVCGHNEKGWLSTGIVSLLTDIMILSLPISSVWKLKLPRGNKIAITGIFGIGFLVCIISILRIISIIRINPKDFTYTSITTDIYSVTEPSLGMVSACLPVMRPLYDKLLPSRYQSQERLGNNNANHANSNQRPSNLGSLPMSRSIFDKGKRETFQRLSDEYAFPLTQIAGEKAAAFDQGVETTIKPTYKTEIGTTAPGHGPDLEQGMPENGINVQREWTVQ